MRAAQPLDRANRVLLEDKTFYYEHRYKDEHELESLAVQNSPALFGHDVVYFDSKKTISSQANITKVPDGMFLTCSSFNNSRLWLVEYELSSHDLDRHVIPQILGFVKALQNDNTKRIIRERIYAAIRKDPDSAAKIRAILPADGEIYHYLESVLNRQLGIVIVIDKITPELEEVADSISVITKIRTRTLEFTTYESEDGRLIHMLDMLHVKDDSKAAGSREGIRYEVWDKRHSKAMPEVRDLVDALIAKIQKELRCVGKAWYKWYAFYLEEPSQRKNLFASIILGRSTATLSFRVDPKKFGESAKIRKVAGFFFPSGNERRIYITKDTMREAIDCVRHSYRVTKELYSKS